MSNRFVLVLPRLGEQLTAKHHEDTANRASVLECAGPPALSSVSRPAKSSRGLEHSRTASALECHGAIRALQCVSSHVIECKKQDADLSGRALR